MNRSVSHNDLQLEEQPPNAVHRQLSDGICQRAQREACKALRACFLRNQDQHFGGILLPVSKKRYNPFSKLLEAVTAALKNRVVLTSAIMKIYRINGTPIRSVDDFYGGDILVCCCQYESFVDVGYNVSRENVRLLGSSILMTDKVKVSVKDDLWDGVIESPIDIKPHELPQAILLYIKVLRPIWQTKWTMIFEGYGKAHNEKRYTIKMVDREHMVRSTKDSYCEMEILRQLQDHDNIVELIYTVEHNKYIYIVMERLDYDVFDLLFKMPFSECVTKKIIKDVAKGLAYIHACQIIHRDLKLDNMLVKLDCSKPGLPLVVAAKISDFGLATYYKGRELHQWCGTPHYIAPEVFNYEGYDFYVDLWSLGVSLFFILCKRLPFADSYSDPRMIQKCIQTENHRVPANYVNRISSEAQNLVNSLLVKSPQNRMSALEVCQHPFLM